MQSKKRDIRRVEIRVSVLSESDLGILLARTHSLYGSVATAKILVGLANLELWFQKIQEVSIDDTPENHVTQDMLLRLRCQIPASSFLFEFLTARSRTKPSGQRGLQVCNLATEVLSRSKFVANHHSHRVERRHTADQSSAIFGNQSAIRKLSFLDD
jgi:hypothetical protein